MIRHAEIKDLNIINSFLKSFNNIVINEEQLTNHPFSRYLVALKGDIIVGFLNYAVMYDKAELNYIYILDEYRHYGYAKEMMEYFIEQIIKSNCLSITLEVAVSNVSAIKLYEQYGFKTISIRKNYYNNEDGLLMIRKLGD